MSGDCTMDWKPAAALANLKARAALLGRLREFLAGRGLLEVDTPLFSSAGNPDVNLHSLRARLQLPDRSAAQDVWFNTSPEFAMKRLLAAGTGPIFQITKVLRDGEIGARHQPEFTMLEWYRPGYDHLQLMDELAELLHALGIPPPGRATYGELFLRHLRLDPHRAPDQALQTRAAVLGLDAAGLDRSALLDFLFERCVVPELAPAGIGFVHGFPSCQAALARVAGEPPVAERFELFLAGMEIANGFHELGDAEEQRRRFDEDNRRRRERGLDEVPIDERLLAALAAGLPDCSGVAIGVDRLLMARQGLTRIDEVIAFPLDRA